MSVSVVAGQIASLAGHKPKLVAAPKPSASVKPARERLRNHPTQCGTTIKGRPAILFGGAFVGMGTFIILITTGVIPTEEGAANAPMWLIGLCGGIFAVPGLWVVSYGIRTSIADARVYRRSHRFPDSPWYYDHPWEETGTSYTDVRSIGRILMFLLIAGGLTGVGHYVVSTGGGGVWPFWIGIGLMDLFLLIGVYYLCRAVIRLFRYGRSRLRFDRFPFHLGRRLDVTWIRPRGMRHCGALTCTLRCIEEVFESAGDDGGKQVAAYAIYEDKKVVEPPMDRESANPEVPLSFELPKGDFDTRLRDHPPRYWQLEIRAANPGVDYLARFLTPVYAD